MYLFTVVMEDEIYTNIRALTATEALYRAVVRWSEESGRLTEHAEQLVVSVVRGDAVAPLQNELDISIHTSGLDKVSGVRH